MKNTQWKYKLSSNLAGLVLSLLMGAVFGGITLYLYRTENDAFYFSALLSVLMLAVILLAIDVPYLLYTGELGVPASFLIPASGIAFVAAAFVVLTIRYRCFKVRIDRSGFYVQTNPFNGKYYRYDRIKSCGAVEKVYRHRRSSGGFRRTHYFYFIFTDRDGEQRKFQFQKDICRHEIEVLQDRIDEAGGTVRR